MAAIKIVHILLVLWLGILAQDVALWKSRRMRLEAEYTGNFEAATRWMEREKGRVMARGIAVVVLIVAGGILAWTGVYS